MIHKRAIARVAILAALTALLAHFVLLPVRKESGSYTLVNLLHFLTQPPQRGDVVAVELVAGRSAVFLKRIVGLPGEKISIHAGQVLINGQPLTETYVTSRSSWDLPETAIESQEYYVIGDARQGPLQYERMGRAPRSRILGKALW
jgi:signal peptidase I